jgi:hemoglobin
MQSDITAGNLDLPGLWVRPKPRAWFDALIPQYAGLAALGSDGHAVVRGLRMTELAFTRSDIETVVADFYARVRRHPVLGPVFQERVPSTDSAWQTHEAKIVEFWCSAILKTRSYSGSPMQAHSNVSGLRGFHFDIWLEVFDTVLSENLPSQTAQHWSRLAHNIGRGLRMGVESNQRNAQVPSLTH